MRSRALPEDFNFTPSMNLHHRELTPSYRSIRSSQNQRLAFGGGSRSATHSAQGHQYISRPNGASITYKNVSSNCSQYDAVTLSPTPSAEDGSQISSGFFPETESPIITTSSFSMPSLVSSVYAVDSQAQRHTRESRKQHTAIGSREGLLEYPVAQPGPHNLLTAKHDAMIWEPDRRSSGYYLASNTTSPDVSHYLSNNQSAHWSFSASRSAKYPSYSSYSSTQPGIRLGLSDRENLASFQTRLQDPTILCDGAAFPLETSQRTSVRNALQQKPGHTFESEMQPTDTSSLGQSSKRRENEYLEYLR